MSAADDPLARPIAPPGSDEYPPYAAMYVDLVPRDGFLLRHLHADGEALVALARGLSPEASLHRYAPGTWSAKEVLVHVADDERIYACRALRFARNDPTELPGFEQDDFARWSGADARPMESIVDELAAVRRASIELFRGLPDAAFDRRGVANGHPYTVRGLAYHLAGHARHHAHLLRTRYGLG